VEELEEGTPDAVMAQTGTEKKKKKVFHVHVSPRDDRPVSDSSS
jgi:hypothetical protein